MVRLHTWLPLEPQHIFEGLRPDAGHSALEVLNDAGAQLAYVSFWPEPGSLIGEITQILKSRPHRHPSTYAEETNPEIGYMQRPSDHVDEIDGLDEDMIAELWSSIQDTGYDLLHWNCSNICKLMIMSSFEPSHRDQLVEVAGCSPDDLAKLSGIAEDLFERLRYLATSPFIDCRPEDVRRMVAAYKLLYEVVEESGCKG